MFFFAESNSGVVALLLALNPEQLLQVRSTLLVVHCWAPHTRSLLLGPTVSLVLPLWGPHLRALGSCLSSPSALDRTPLTHHCSPFRMPVLTHKSTCFWVPLGCGLCCQNTSGICPRPFLSLLRWHPLWAAFHGCFWLPTTCCSLLLHSSSLLRAISSTCTLLSLQRALQSWGLRALKSWAPCGLFTNELSLFYMVPLLSFSSLLNLPGPEALLRYPFPLLSFP